MYNLICSVCKAVLKEEEYFEALDQKTVLIKVTCPNKNCGLVNGNLKIDKNLINNWI